MAVDLSTLDLPQITTDNFFNEFEISILNYITTNGSGFYKLSQDQSGAFVSVETATAASETNAAMDEETNDRVISSDENYNYMYVNFLV